MSEEKRLEAERALKKIGVEETEEAAERKVEVEEEKVIDEDIAGAVAILNTIGDLLKNLGPLIDNIVKTILSAVDGEKVGSEVASMYKKLKEAGLPDDVVIEMTKKFFDKRISLLNITELIERFVKSEILEEEEKE